MQAGNVAPGQIRWFDTTPTLDKQDWYFFGHGLEYRAALKDWTLIMGPPALPPLSVFGIWYSRYYPYSQSSFVKDVRAHLPFLSYNRIELTPPQTHPRFSKAIMTMRCH